MSLWLVVAVFKPCGGNQPLFTWRRESRFAQPGFPVRSRWTAESGFCFSFGHFYFTNPSKVSSFFLNTRHATSTVFGNLYLRPFMLMFTVGLNVENLAQRNFQARKDPDGNRVIVLVNVKGQAFPKVKHRKPVHFGIHHPVFPNPRLFVQP